MLDIKGYATARGWQLRVHEMDELPAHLRESYIQREWGVWGIASVCPGTSYPRAEIAHIPTADPSVQFAALLHEMGHCEQMDAYGDPWRFLTDMVPPKVNPAPLWLQLEEADAWHRGIRIGAELGLPYWSSSAKAFALGCAFTYGPVCLEETARALMPDDQVAIVRRLFH